METEYVGGVFSNRVGLASGCGLFMVFAFTRPYSVILDGIFG